MEDTITEEDINQRTPWSAAEDRKLFDLVSANGARKWDDIAKNFPLRNGKQCRNRWLNHVNPDVKKGGWSHEEDRIIISKVQQIGAKWSVIAKELPGRTDSAIKNRYYSFVRHKVAPRPESWVTTGLALVDPDIAAQELAMRTALMMEKSSSSTDDDDSSSQSSDAPRRRKSKPGRKSTTGRTAKKIVKKANILLRSTSTSPSQSSESTSISSTNKTPLKPETKHAELSVDSDSSQSKIDLLADLAASSELDLSAPAVQNTVNSRMECVATVKKSSIHLLCGTPKHAASTPMECNDHCSHTPDKKRMHDESGNGDELTSSHSAKKRKSNPISISDIIHDCRSQGQHCNGRDDGSFIEGDAWDTSCSEPRVRPGSIPSLSLTGLLTKPPHTVGHTPADPSLSLPPLLLHTHNRFTSRPLCLVEDSPPSSVPKSTIRVDSTPISNIPSAAGSRSKFIANANNTNSNSNNKASISFLVHGGDDAAVDAGVADSDTGLCSRLWSSGTRARGCDRMGSEQRTHCPV